MRWSVSGLRPSFVRLVTQQGHRSESGLWARLRTALGGFSTTARGPRSGPGVPVSRSGDHVDPLLNRATAPICCTFVTRHVVGLLQAFC